MRMMWSKSWSNRSTAILNAAYEHTLCQTVQIYSDYLVKTIYGYPTFHFLTAISRIYYSSYPDMCIIFFFYFQVELLP